MIWLDAILVDPIWKLTDRFIAHTFHRTYINPYTEVLNEHRISFFIGYKIGQLLCELIIKPIVILAILFNALGQIIDVLFLRTDEKPDEIPGQKPDEVPTENQTFH